MSSFSSSSQQNLLFHLSSLLKGRILFLVAVDVFASANEQFCSGGNGLAGTWIDKGFGERGHYGRVVNDESWIAALRLDEGFGECVEETG